MANEENLQQLGRQFKNFMDEVKEHGKATITMENLQAGDLVVKDTEESVRSGGPVGDLAFRDLYAGPDIPNSSLGRDGDLYFRIKAVNRSNMPEVANWQHMVSVTAPGSAEQRLLCIADGSDFVAKTTNGTSWELVPMPQEARWSGVATNGKGQVVAVAFNSEVAISNDGGDTWTEGGKLTEGPQWNHIAYANGRYVATAYGVWHGKGDGQLTDTVAVSTNGGVSWTYHTLPEPVFTAGITGSSTKGFVVACPHTSYAFHSMDGTTWKKVMLPVDAVWVAPTVGHDGNSDVFVMMGQGSQFGLTSTDPARGWQTSDMPFTAGWRINIPGRGAGPGRITWVALPGHADAVAVSFNSGASWKEYAVGESAQWIAGGYINGKYVIAGYGTATTLVIDEGDLTLDPSLTKDDPDLPDVNNPDPDQGQAPAPIAPSPDPEGDFTAVLSSTPGDLMLACIVDQGSAHWKSSVGGGNVSGRWLNTPNGCTEIIYRALSGYSAELIIRGDENLISKLALFNYPTLTVKCINSYSQEIYHVEVDITTVATSLTEVRIPLDSSTFSPYSGRHYFSIK